MIATYDPKEVDFVFGPVIAEGYADGQFILAARDNPMWTSGTGSDGSGYRAKSNDKSGTVTLTLLQVSPTNDELTDAAQADEQAGAGVFPLVIKDRSGRTLCGAQAAWIEKFPDSTFERDNSNRQWVFKTTQLDIFVGGNGGLQP